MPRNPKAFLQAMLLGLIGGYRRWISPLLPPACRFHPACSDYAAESIRTHGPYRGTALAVWRVCRCHPMSPGGFDPVPTRGDRRQDTDPATGPTLAMKEVR